MTTRDIGVERWQLNDEVLSLRWWATEHSQALPTASGKEWTIGSEESAWLRLEDSQGRVSRKHASILRREGKWILRDSGSMNGVIVQGRRCAEIVLEPAQEIWLGGITMVAESGRSLAFREFLHRLHGWGNDRARIVDLARRSIRVAAMREAALVIYGEDDDIVLLARALQRYALGPDRPFVMCDPSRTQANDNVRVVRNYTKGMEALKAAKGGSLCIWDKLPPRDFVDVKRALQDPDTRTTLIVCMQQPADAEAYGVTPIVIPSVKRRTGDLPRIVDEYSRDAAAELGLPAADLPHEYRGWIVANEATSFTNIEKAARRLLALREANGNVGRAAKLLGMGRWSLAKWIRRRRLPMAVQS